MARNNKNKLDWQKLFREQSESGESVKDFCQKHNIAPARFSSAKWRTKLNKPINPSQPQSKFKKVIVSSQSSFLISGIFEFKSGTKFHVQNIAIDQFKTLTEVG